MPSVHADTVENPDDPVVGDDIENIEEVDDENTEEVDDEKENNENTEEVDDEKEINENTEDFDDNENTEDFDDNENTNDITHNDAVDTTRDFGTAGGSFLVAVLDIGGKALNGATCFLRGGSNCDYYSLAVVIIIILIIYYLIVGIDWDSWRTPPPTKTEL